MMRSLIVAAGLALVVQSASAQKPADQAKKTTQPAAPTAAAKQAPAAKAPAAKGLTSKTQAPGKKLAVVVADTSGPPPTIMREMYVYSADGRRDPFVSLLTTNELRPALSDLALMSILFDHAAPRHSIATFRDVVTNARYRVSPGSKLGRMTVASIRTRAVVFTIDEFGTTRQDSLVLGDSTKARGK